MIKYPAGDKSGQFHRASRHFGVPLFVVMALAVLLFSPSKAAAAESCKCYENACCGLIPTDQTVGMQPYQRWIVNDFFEEHVRPALQSVTEQLTALGLYQVFAVGTFFDAKHQLETQRLFQRLTAEAHRDYQPSVDICVMGTNVRSLAASHGRGEANASALSQRSLDRHLGHRYANAGQGPQEDREGRLAQFVETFCDPNDFDGAFKALCLKDGTGKFYTDYWPEERNRDINYTATIDQPWTIDADYVTDWGDDSEDVLAMASNLYGHDVFSRPTRHVIEKKQAQDIYLDARAVTAKRSVAENSFQAVVELKSPGTLEAEDSREYMVHILNQLGLPVTDTDGKDAIEILGERPSYYAQLELLAQKLYQNPSFYTNLYDKPANILRKEVAMQGIGLMVDREMYESELRYEMMLAVMLETELIKQQEAVENRITRITKTGKEN